MKCGDIMGMLAASFENFYYKVLPFNLKIKT